MSYPKYREVHSITPSDTTPISRCKSIYIGSGPNGITADIAFKMPSAMYDTGSAQHHGFTGGNSVTFKNVPVGTFLPISPTHVKSTGTDATDILSLL